MDLIFQIAEYGFRDQYYIHASSIWAWVNPGPTGTYYFRLYVTHYGLR